MKVLYVFTAILAISLAESNDSQRLDDLVAAESVGLVKEGTDYYPAARSYNYVSPSQGTSQWNQPQQNPMNTYVPPPSPIIPPQNDYVYQHNTYAPPQYTYPPTWSTPHHHPPTTTTPVAVIKNELYYGDNGSYKYEYQIADGTHVGEEGYFTDPKATDESLVKKGWYSYTAADGKVYTVTYWADKTGFHAYGDHLPTPPPVPPAIQAALDQKAKEEAEKNKLQTTYPNQIYYPTTQKPIYQTTYYPTTQKPIYQTTHSPYYPSQQVYYPQEQNYPSYGKK